MLSNSMDPSSTTILFSFHFFILLKSFYLHMFVVFKITIVIMCLNVNNKLDMLGKIFNTTVHCNLASTNVSSHSAHHLPIPNVSLYTMNSQSLSTTYNAYLFPVAFLFSLVLVWCIGKNADARRTYVA